ncbi:unnamed protein product [Prorocentrum cordatum]|uniref:Uncharacterized protein n=1 Tax=Prorocentrum cordatum TaxID=2364126 RepID=A0ABN9SI26_9DINO|nr:unnamed protein product [Polarella glacialis]
MCFTLEGGGNSETVCIAGLQVETASQRLSLALILVLQLVSPTEFAYPAGSTLTWLPGVSISSTWAPASSLPSTTSQAMNGSVHDDPHVCALDGECYDIRAPSEYILLRAPFNTQESHPRSS